MRSIILTGLAAGAVTVSLAAPAGAAPNPPAPPAVHNLTHAPHFTRHGWHHNTGIRVTVTNPARSCVVVGKEGGSLSAKATGVVRNRRGQVVKGVQLLAVNPDGDQKASRAMYWTGTVYNGSVHIPAAVIPGTWSAVAGAQYIGNNGDTSSDFGTAPFCVQRNAYMGTVHVSDDSPYRGQRITLTGAFMGLNANGKSYSPKGQRIVKVLKLIHNTWTQVGTVSSDTKGVLSYTLNFRGPTRYAFSYAGSTTYRAWVSNSVLVG